MTGTAGTSGSGLRAEQKRRTRRGCVCPAGYHGSMRWTRVVTLALATVLARVAVAEPERAGGSPEAAKRPPEDAGPTEGDGLREDGGPHGDGGSREHGGPNPDPGHDPVAPRASAQAEEATGAGQAAVAGAPAERRPGAPAVSAGRRAAAIAVAIFPGVLLRGAGSWVAGAHRAARRLAATGAIGFATLAAGGVPIGVSASNPYTIWPGVPLVVAGTGVFLSSWLADVWVAAGGGALTAWPIALPPWSIDVATTWQHDAYRERALLGAAGHVELGRLGLDASGYVDAGNAWRSGEAGVRWRLLGPPPTGRAVGDGSRVVVRAAARLDRDDGDRVTLAAAEAELSGRLDLDRLDPAIRGSFLALSAGGGFTRTSYPRGRHDNAALLLAGFAWGAYLGDRGEVAVFYDHRRDGLAGGLAASRGAGFVGSFGASAELRVHGPWAVRGALQVGNAWVTTLGVRYLGGR